MQQNWIGDLDVITEILARWRGGRAQPIAYTTSHGVFILALFPSPRTSSKVAYIQCKDCRVIQMYQTEWENANIAIAAVPHGFGRVHTVIDPGRLHIVCFATFATEVDTPINFFKEWGTFPDYAP